MIAMKNIEEKGNRRTKQRWYENGVKFNRCTCKKSEYKQERNRIEDKVRTLLKCKKEKVKIGVNQKILKWKTR